MKGWVKKDAILLATRPTSIMGWQLRGYNVWVPCLIQEQDSQTFSETIEVKVRVPFGILCAFRVPVSEVMFTHKYLRHFLPLRAWSLFRATLREAKILR